MPQGINGYVFYMVLVTFLYKSSANVR